MRPSQARRNRSKNQHWVPQFYLSCFATPETRDTDSPKAWIFSKIATDTDETKPTNVRNICAKHYLYSPIGKDGLRTWDVDERIDSLESTLGSAWPVLINDFVDLRDPMIRKGVSLFVAVMQLRNPESRKALEAMHAQVVSLFDQAPKDASGIPAVRAIRVRDKEFQLDPADWHEYRNWTQNDHHAFFVQMIEQLASDIATELIARRWSVIYSQEDTFITSDRPVVLQHEMCNSPGISTPGSIIYFPLSPKRMLVMDDLHSEPDGQYYALQPNVSAALNLGTWLNATRFMITGRSVDAVLAEMVPIAESYGTRDA